MDKFMSQLAEYRALTAYERHLENLTEQLKHLAGLDAIDVALAGQGLLANDELLGRLLRRQAQRERVRTAIFYQTCKIEEVTYGLGQ